MSNVKLADINKNYGSFHALKNINLDIAPGEFVVMVGPSGCGKSTLLKTIAGLEDVASGLIEIAGKDVTHEEPGDRGIAMVFQSYALYPHMTVRDNMGFGLRIMKRPAAEIEAAVGKAAKILRIENLLDKKPAQLSGGQRQRVAIGRAITRQPHVFLFDEPLSNLDAALRTQMRVELASLHKALDATMIYVTHDQVEAMTMADRIVVLHAGEIEQVGAPLQLYNNPCNRFVASFLGSPRMNFFEGRVETVTSATARVHLAGLGSVTFNNISEKHGLKTGEQITVGVRPEHFILASDMPVMARGRLRLSEELGRETVLYVAAGALKAIGSDTGTSDVTLLTNLPVALEDDMIDFGFSPEDAYLFGPDGKTITIEKPLRHEHARRAKG
ncbi:sn-glycerol-3-phosphate ABC transporter ATP-binding protein UgpC [Martelella sp. HB161492]|uniref:ABC transporter ATP-binding protein n=1 Tax=Martelella sp. HB161492 TaxID=2720726 RepID=UPI0015918726|nr:sn-glycerol-3-phosphate ABC transporter ATP-binding protein UgpC [Martelella sp. HB161492]